MNQGFHLAVGDAPLQHPEAAVRMDITETLDTTDGVGGSIDGPGDLVRALDAIVFDVDDADPDPDLRANIGQGSQLRLVPARTST